MTDLAIEKAQLSLDDFLALDERVEIIDGEVIVAGGVGIGHHVIAGNVYRPMDKFVVQNDLGVVLFNGVIYMMFSDAGGLKDSFMPDVSFIRKAHWLPHFDLDKPYPGIPDLAVEVVSPGDDAEKVQKKSRTYLDKGTEQVWVLYPSLHEVHQYHLDKPTLDIYRSGALDVEALFPGLELTIEMIFALPDWMQKV